MLEQAQEQQGAYSAPGGMSPGLPGAPPGQEQGYEDEAYPETHGEGAYDSYPNYQPYQDAMGSDVISEIAEQVVSERVSGMQDKLERVIDIRTVLEARMGNLNERLRRLEKIIDTLQLSILQKVGEYVTDVKDLKKEHAETQKSFKVLHRRKSHAHKVHGK